MTPFNEECLVRGVLRAVEALADKAKQQSLPDDGFIGLWVRVKTSRGGRQVVINARITRSPYTGEWGE